MCFLPAPATSPKATTVEVCLSGCQPDTFHGQLPSGEHTQDRPHLKADVKRQLQRTVTTVCWHKQYDCMLTLLSLSGSSNITTTADRTQVTSLREVMTLVFMSDLADSLSFFFSFFALFLFFLHFEMWFVSVADNLLHSLSLPWQASCFLSRLQSLTPWGRKL